MRFSAGMYGVLAFMYRILGAEAEAKGVGSAGWRSGRREMVVSVEKGVSLNYDGHGQGKGGGSVLGGSFWSLWCGSRLSRFRGLVLGFEAVFWAGAVVAWGCAA